MMDSTVQKYHSLCAWTFNGGKGGFTPSDSRPEWMGENFDTVAKIELIAEKIAPRLPQHIKLGLEIHYDYEYNEQTADQIAETLCETDIKLAMVTPGAHKYFAYGGICSLDSAERIAAARFGENALSLAYGPLKKAWSSDVPPTLVLWNGSYGYDLATPVIADMYQFLKEHIASLCEMESNLGGEMHIGLEPKPNEGHPAMLIPTVASAIVFWNRLEKEYGTDITRKGVNKEFGHSEMIGLDHVYDTVEEIDNDMLVHMHINSQGYNDGIILGGPGKYDIDNGARINAMNIAIAKMMQQSGYNRWRGHDMQVRPYDSVQQGIDRVVRSVLSWDACEHAAANLDLKELVSLLAERRAAEAEDMMRRLVHEAWNYFDELYSQAPRAVGK